MPDFTPEERALWEAQFGNPGTVPQGPMLPPVRAAPMSQQLPAGDVPTEPLIAAAGLGQRTVALGSPAGAVAPVPAGASAGLGLGAGADYSKLLGLSDATSTGTSGRTWEPGWTDERRGEMRQSVGAQQGAIQEGGRLAVERGKEIASAQGDARYAQMASNTTYDMQREMLREQHLDPAEREMLASVDDLKKAKVDPNQWWSSRSVPQKIFAALGAAFGAAAQGFSGGRVANTALQLIQGEIDRDISAQKANIVAKRGAVDAQKGLVAYYYRKLGDIDKAEIFARDRLTMHANGMLDSIKAKYAGRGAELEAQMAGEQLKQRALAAEAASYGKMSRGGSMSSGMSPFRKGLAVAGLEQKDKALQAATAARAAMTNSRDVYAQRAEEGAKMKRAGVGDPGVREYDKHVQALRDNLTWLKRDVVPTLGQSDSGVVGTIKGLGRRAVSALPIDTEMKAEWAHAGMALLKNVSALSGKTMTEFELKRAEKDAIGPGDTMATAAIKMGRVGGQAVNGLLAQARLHRSEGRNELAQRRLQEAMEVGKLFSQTHPAVRLKFVDALKAAKVDPLPFAGTR